MGVTWICFVGRLVQVQKGLLLLRNKRGVGLNPILKLRAKNCAYFQLSDQVACACVCMRVYICIVCVRMCVRSCVCAHACVCILIDR